MTARTVRRAALGLLLALPSAASESIGGANYSVEWSTLDGGGGRSSGGSYAVHGTIGQIDAEPLHPASSGPYALHSGFWVGVQVQPVADDLFLDGFEAQ